MDGVGRPRVNRQGAKVIGLTFDVDKLLAYAEYQKKLGMTNITVDVSAEGFTASEKSKVPGQVLHSFVSRGWVKKITQ